MRDLRYVVLRHEGIPAPHFDLMFETEPGSKLATWRSDAWPILQPIALTRLADHRRDYLEYEGPLTGERGSVLRIGAGTCAIDRSTPRMWRIDLANGVLQFQDTSEGWIGGPAERS